MTFGSRSLSFILLLYVANLCTDIRGPLVDGIVAKIFYIPFLWVLLSTVSHNSAIGISKCNKTLIRLSSKHVTAIEYGYSER
ncbi:hypothetical protein BDQ94DRAFT_17063 [Aspergillus welwitschiae]|uniref:Uncharacterized protein n=1 Tax=Aspergillus welwitschiae TaxID=1341132 RepID=A0A3F3Q741_9EURO|nr:hypothetical protein BDQ94DRAFT_17063 [Aspergillus welwitschiae]RDH34935.1 hypothetical protein BDQ94DRAFT_17063 [Aspergillus welwitschiae]